MKSQCIWGIGSQGKIARISAHSAVQYGAENDPISRPAGCLNSGDNADRGDPTAVSDGYPLRFLTIVARITFGDGHNVRNEQRQKTSVGVVGIRP
jgi:hypothetical protein